MPVKILGQAGVSLADAYDVEGSIAGVEELDADSVKTVHEMGATIHSERLGGAIRRATSGAQLQNVAFDHAIIDLPGVPYRILGVSALVISGVSGRIAHYQISLRNEAAGREMPIFVWDGGFDQEPSVRIQDNNNPAASIPLLRPTSHAFNSMPNLMIAGQNQPQVLDRIQVRGLTSGFGAGTVDVALLVYIAFSDLGTSISSYGLPIPGW